MFSRPVLKRRLFVICLLCPLLSAYTVEQGHIKDGEGNAVQLRGVGWYGAEVGNLLVPSGLYKRNYKNLIAETKSLGFNAIRLPFCPRTITAPAIAEDFFWVNKNKNPGLYNPDGSGKTPFEIYTIIAEELDRQGFYILADHHLINCPDIVPPSVAITPLWYTPEYSEEQWIKNLVTVTRRLAHLDGLIGMDLNNEPHGGTWAEDKPKTDWDAAAERAAKAVMAVAPDILVFVQGVAGNTTCGGNDYPYWFSNWGGNLSRQYCEPINLPANKLVLSPHVYGPAEGVQGDDGPYYFTTDARNPQGNPGKPSDIARAMPEVWDQWFGRLANPENGNFAIAIGEFGIRYGRFITQQDDPLLGIQASDTPAQKQKKREDFAPNMARDKPWADALVGYLTEKGITDSFWWPLNGDGLAGGIYYGNALPRPDGTVNPDDQWVKVREDIVSADPNSPGLLNRYWSLAACNDGVDNDQDGLADEDDPECAAGRALGP